MTTKHQPATPLPFTVIESRGARPAIYINGRYSEYSVATHSIAKLYNLMGWQQDAAYIAHAANAYPKLVEALISAAGALHLGEAHGAAAQAHALLRELGEMT